MGESLLAVENLSVAFGEGAPVVEGVSLSIRPGEKLALVGESGSGKSVTALSVLRLHDPGHTRYPSGRIVFQGKELLAAPESEVRKVRGRDVAMIFQEPMTSLNPVYTVGEQLMEPLLVHEGMDRAAARARSIELLGLVGIPDPARRMEDYPHTLSGGQRQRVMIAMALSCRPKLLIADEPTTALDVTIQKQILDLLDKLQREFNMAVLLITHDLAVVKRFAERVCVMQRGRIVEQAPTEQLFASPGHPYTRQLLASVPEPLDAGQRADLGAPPLLEAHALRCHFPLKRGFFGRQAGVIRAVDDVHLEIRSGETVGIVGESGSGKSTLGLCLLRLQACEGQVQFDGQDLGPLSQRALRSVRRHLQVVFQDPYSSLSPRLTVEQIVGEGLQIHFPHLTRSERRKRVCSVMEEVGLNESMLSRYPHEFSGGQRQRIAIARAVVLEPKLMLLDEPTSALDVSVQKQVLALLGSLQRKHHMSYLFISHDLKVVRAVAHRVVVMKEGRVVESGDTERIFSRPEHDYTRLLLNASLLS